MRKLLLATAAVAIIGIAGTARADTIDLDLADMETMTAGAYLPGFNFDYTKHGQVYVQKYIDIAARVHVKPEIKGNFADGEAAATAYGKNTYTETLTFADVIEGVLSRSGSSSIAATVGSHYGGHKGYKRAY